MADKGKEIWFLGEEAVAESRRELSGVGGRFQEEALPFIKAQVCKCTVVPVGLSLISSPKSWQQSTKLDASSPLSVIGITPLRLLPAPQGARNDPQNWGSLQSRRKGWVAPSAHEPGLTFSQLEDSRSCPGMAPWISCRNLGC